MMSAVPMPFAPSPRDLSAPRTPEGAPRLIWNYVFPIYALFEGEANASADPAAWKSIANELEALHARFWAKVKGDHRDSHMADTLRSMIVRDVTRLEAVIGNGAQGYDALSGWNNARSELEEASDVWPRHAGMAFVYYCTYAAVGWLGLRYAIHAGVTPEVARAAVLDLPQPRKDVARTSFQEALEEAVLHRPPPATTAPVLALDGQKLEGSIFWTWLMLVNFSWVALIWGTVLTIPIGYGLIMLFTLSSWFFWVPAWATLWGFLGMGFARDSTLKQMGFKEVGPDDELRRVTAAYAQALGLATPQVGTIPKFNAFAMGFSRNDATVAIGEQLVLELKPQEVAAVIGHELGHVASGDMRKMMLMRTFQNATVWFAVTQGLKQFTRWIISWAAELAILRFSRKREYWADAIGAALAGKEAMIGALRKLEAGPKLSAAENTHARFMFRGRVGLLFSTHPSTEQRIRALESEKYMRRLPFRVPPQ